MTTVDIVRIEFRSNVFDTEGEPPDGAINGQYGRDLCEWLCDCLSDTDFHFGAEDWGWYVETRVTRNEELGAEAHEVRVYDHGDSGVLDEPAWMIVIATSKKVPRLRFFTKWQDVDVNRDFASTVLERLRSVATGEILAELVRIDRSGNDRGSQPFAVPATP